MVSTTASAAGGRRPSSRSGQATSPRNHDALVGPGRGCSRPLSGNQPAQRLYARVGFAGYQLDPAMGDARFLQKWLT